MSLPQRRCVAFRSFGFGPVPWQPPSVFLGHAPGANCQTCAAGFHPQRLRKAGLPLRAQDSTFKSSLSPRRACRNVQS